MGAWVHHAFQGHWWGPFLPGWQFGVPELVEREYAVFPTSHTGWDGQFYYYQANDILALQDTPKHLDNPPYRYQRIGAPLIARMVSYLFGYRQVPGMIYLLSQVTLVAVAYGFLVSWLRKNGHSSLWAMAWLCCDGVVNALAFGMPDPVGDALFVIAAIGLLTNRIGIYLAAAMFLPLVREAYALICGLIALATGLGWISWGAGEGMSPLKRLFGLLFRNADQATPKSESQPTPSSLLSNVTARVSGPFATTWINVVIVALPCVAVLAWHYYVTRRFGISPSKAGSGVMLDYPFFGFWQGLTMAIHRRQPLEIGLHLFGVLLIILTMWNTWQQKHRSPLTVICLPYLALLLCMSWVAWEDFSGYLKAAGTAIVLLLLFLPERPGKVRYFFLIFLISEGLVMGYHRKAKLQFVPYKEPTPITQNATLSGEPIDGPLSEYSAKIEVLDQDSLLAGVKSSYVGIWSPFHRELGKTISVKVTNTSNIAWRPLPERGMHAVNLSYQWRDAASKNVVLEIVRVPIGETIEPGSSKVFEMDMLYPTHGKYILAISMIQEGHIWFYDRCPQFELPITIP